MRISYYWDLFYIYRVAELFYWRAWTWDWFFKCFLLWYMTTTVDAHLGFDDFLQLADDNRSWWLVIWILWFYICLSWISKMPLSAFDFILIWLFVTKIEQIDKMLIVYDLDLSLILYESRTKCQCSNMYIFQLLHFHLA